MALQHANEPLTLTYLSISIATPIATCKPPPLFTLINAFITTIALTPTYLTAALACNTLSIQQLQFLMDILIALVKYF